MTFGLTRYPIVDPMAVRSSRNGILVNDHDRNRTSGVLAPVAMLSITWR